MIEKVFVISDDLHAYLFPFHSQTISQKRNEERREGEKEKEGRGGEGGREEKKAKGGRGEGRKKNGTNRTTGNQVVALNSSTESGRTQIVLHLVSVRYDILQNYLKIFGLFKSSFIFHLYHLHKRRKKW